MSTGRIGYKSGMWVPEEELTVHIYDEQFMFGTGVFEMHRTFKHKHFLLDEHIDRLFMSMKSFRIPIDKTREEIKAIFDELQVRNIDQFKDDEFRFMVNVSRGPLSIYREVFELADGDQWNKPTWIFNAWPLSKTTKTLAHFYETGANAITVPQRQIPSQFLDPKVKSRSRAHYQIANLEASRFGKDACALLLDDQGFVCEGTGANFLLIKNECIVMPERRNILRGCSMEYIVGHIARELSLPVIEKNIEPYDVLEADEAMFTGTFNNILPCNRMNGILLRGFEERKPYCELDTVMGPVTQKICKQWSENVGVDFIKQIKNWAVV